MSVESDASNIRIIVLGDSEVGKSSFLNLLCKSKVLATPSRTIGFKTSVLIYTLLDREYCLEFVEIGPYKQAATRSVLYNHANGIIFVHDLSNKKSLKLWKWMEEALSNIYPKSSEYELFLHIDNVLPKAKQIPLLIIGNKSDLASILQTTEFNDDYNCESINMCSLDPKTTERSDFKAMFNRFIEKCNKFKKGEGNFMGNKYL